MWSHRVEVEYLKPTDGGRQNSGLPHMSDNWLLLSRHCYSITSPLRGGLEWSDEVKLLIPKQYNCEFHIESETQ